MNTTVDKAKAKVISEEIKQAVEAILAKHNLETTKISTGHGDWFEFKVQATAIQLGLNGVNLATKHALAYTKFGFTSYANGEATELTAPLGTKFTFRNAEYIFIGINGASKKNPIVIRSVVNGAEYGMPESGISLINEAAGTDDETCTCEIAFTGNCASCRSEA